MTRGNFSFYHPAHVGVFAGGQSLQFRQTAFPQCQGSLERHIMAETLSEFHPSPNLHIEEAHKSNLPKKVALPETHYCSNGAFRLMHLSESLSKSVCEHVGEACICLYAFGMSACAGILASVCEACRCDFSKHTCEVNPE